MDTLASWLDHRQVPLLRALLEGGEAPRLAGSAGLMRKALGALDALRADARLKYAELRGRWEQRLAAPALLPFLRRNQWIVEPAEGGAVPAGKGDRKEAKMLYLQTLHDMAADCARQWGAVSGRWQALQAEIAAAWHATISDNASRVPAALEAALRPGETEFWTSLRQSLADDSEESFICGVKDWEGRRFADAESLVRDLPLPWRGAGGTANGFAGFMRALSLSAERLCLAMLDHYSRKWELFFRGFAAA